MVVKDDKEALSPLECRAVLCAYFGWLRPYAVKRILSSATRCVVAALRIAVYALKRGDVPKALVSNTLWEKSLDAT